MTKTPAERRRKADQALRDKGLVRKSVWILPEHADKLKKLEAKSRKEAIIKLSQT